MEVLSYIQQPQQKECEVNLNEATNAVTMSTIQHQRFKIVKIDRRLNNEGKVRDELTGKISYKRGRWSVVDYYDVVPAPVCNEPLTVHSHQPSLPVNHNTINVQSSVSICQSSSQQNANVHSGGAANNGGELHHQNTVDEDYKHKEESAREKDEPMVCTESHQQDQSNVHDGKGHVMVDTCSDTPSPGTPLKQVTNLQRQSSQLSPQVSVQSPTKSEVHHEPLSIETEIISSAAVITTVVTEAQPVAEKEQSKDDVKNGPSVAIDNKIEQAMDLVKSHLMFAVREEVEVLKDRIEELVEKIQVLELENALLKSHVPPEILATLNLVSNGQPLSVQSLPQQSGLPAGQPTQAPVGQSAPVSQQQQQTTFQPNSNVQSVPAAQSVPQTLPSQTGQSVAQADIVMTNAFPEPVMQTEAAINATRPEN
ncbi:Uncharacterized protein HDE_11687 [Halotydeus destructor]|nr:Uncharacterized protein HDE_11687 [Halotydeus destructor]